MKRLSLAFVATLMVYAGFAQTYPQRGRIENVTDYSSLLNTSSKNGARRVGVRSTAPLPCMGSPKIPVILVQFADIKFKDYDKESVVNKRYDDYFNLKEGNASPSLGSVYQYFKEQSYGQFTPEFDVIGPITLSKNVAYYGKDNNNNKDVNIKLFFEETCQQVVEKENKDWSTFDNNNDENVDMIFFIYAGEGQNAHPDMPELIWPKESVSPMTVSGITFGAYGCTNELFSGNIDGIGTAVHELSHGLGLPDLYDTQNNGRTNIDAWDVMDGGNYQISGCAPIGYSAYERDFMGWRSIETLEKDKAYTLEIKPLETDGVAYKILNPANSKEYIILENRQNLGMYDTYMPWPNKDYYTKFGKIHGLMITHVDYDEYAWTHNKVNIEESHQRYGIVPSDGEVIPFWVEKDIATGNQKAESASADLYPGKNNVREISSYAMFTGGKLTQTINNIREKDGIIYVDINGGTIIPQLLQQLNDDVTAANAYTGKKMGKKEASALSAAITAAGSVARDQDAIETAIANLQSAVKAAKTSINLYKNVLAVINNAAKLGDAGKASFAAADVQTAYDNGTITSLADVNKAYDDAVAAQAEADEVAALKATLANDVITAKTYTSSKMDKNVAKTLTDAITAAENVGNTREAVNTASTNLANAVNAAKKSIKLYKDVLAVINNAAKLGDAGKASFAAAGVQTAYDNGTITSLADVNKAYDDAVAAQAEADEVAALKATLANDVITAKTYTSSKMDKKVAKTLTDAITAAENVGNTREAVNTASTNLASAVANAQTSINLYTQALEIIKKVAELGEAGKTSFEESGIPAAYNNGTLKSLDDVTNAYNAAVHAQEIANGINSVDADSQSQRIITIDGREASTPVKGINIIRTANGKTRKTMIK